MLKHVHCINAFQRMQYLSLCRVMMVPQTVVYFTAYDQLKARLGLEHGQHNLYAPMISGMSARGELKNVFVRL